MFSKIKSFILSHFNDPKTRKQFFRYAVTGFTSFAFEYTSFGLLLYLFKSLKLAWYTNLFDTVSRISLYLFDTHLTEISYRSLVSNFLVFNVIFWLVFLMNRFWSFESKEPLGKQLLAFGILFIFNLTVGNIVLLYVLTNLFGIHPMLAKLVIMGVIVSWNFIIYKKVIYKN